MSAWNEVGNIERERAAQKTARAQADRQAEADRAARAEQVRLNAVNTLRSSRAIDALKDIAAHAPDSGDRQLYVDQEGRATLIMGGEPGGFMRQISAKADGVTGSVAIGTTENFVSAEQMRADPNAVSRAAAQAYLGSERSYVAPTPVQSPTTHSPYIVKGGYAHTGEEACCHCLSKGSLIDTPNGTVKVEKLKSGDLVFTVNGKGIKKISAISKIAKVLAGKNHKMLKVKLKNGSEIIVSLEHPDKNGTPLIRALGSSYINDIPVIDIELIKYQEKYTYDILPAGDTGSYWVNDVLLGSTLSSNFQHEFCSHSLSV